MFLSTNRSCCVKTIIIEPAQRVSRRVPKGKICPQLFSRYTSYCAIFAYMRTYMCTSVFKVFLKSRFRVKIISQRVSFHTSRADDKYHKARFGGPKEAPGEVRGGVRGVLGRPEGIRGRLGAVLEAILRQSDFRTFFVSMLGSSWAILEPSWAPQAGGKGAQVGAETEPKSKTKTTMRQEGLQDRLGEVLKPSWGDLRAVLAALEAILGRFRGVRGRQNSGFTLGFSLFFEKSFFCIKTRILAGLGAILGPLGANLRRLGPILARFGRPRGAKREPKTSPRGAKNETKITSKFGSIFETILTLSSAIWVPQGRFPQWSPSGLPVESGAGLADCAPPVLLLKLLRNSSKRLQTLKTTLSSHTPVRPQGDAPY